jgi:transposase
MPRPIPIPIRLAAFRLWKQGRQTHEIAAWLGLARSTVRRLLARFRSRGDQGLEPSYHRPTNAPVEPPVVIQAALRLRREHPTWGGGFIREVLLLGMPEEVVPSVRALQRWFVKYDLNPAPSGRRPVVGMARSVVPHETWQMDAKEHIKLSTDDEVSWLRISDECSGAILWSAVFPPGGLHSGPRRGCAGADPLGAESVGAAGPVPGRQRRPVGFVGRLPYRAGTVGDRSGGRDALESSQASPGERCGRAVPGDVQPLVSAASNS